MEKVFDFLKRHKEVAFATVEGDKPKIRVFRNYKQEQDSLYFVTASRKEVYRQLQLNPSIKVLAMVNNISVRVMGQVAFDVDNKIAQEIYVANPVLPRLYKSYAYPSIK